MRTEITSSPALAAARLRAHAVRARRWLWNRAPATRWALAVAVSVALAALMVRGYVATPVAPAVDYLYAGQRFATDEIDAITRALAVKHIKPHVDGSGRIGVASDQIDEATDVVAKLDVGPRSISEIREWANQSSLWASPTETERRQTQAREKILENMIRNLDGIVGAYVKINRTRPPGGFRPTSASAATAFVCLQTERNREIGSKTVQSIQTILKGYEPDLKHDAVTVVDQKGRHYLDAGNPAVGAISRTRAREEELEPEDPRAARLDQGRERHGAIAARTPPPSSPPRRLRPRSATPPAPGEGLVPPAPLMTLNRPLEIGPEPEAGPTPAPVPAATAGEPKPAGGGGQGTVWVKVPRSFYKRMIEKEPSLELAAVKAHNEKDIRTAVELVVPRGEPWTVKIGSILDDSTAAGPLPSRTASPSRRPIPWWSLAVTAAAVALTVMAAAYRTVVSRRPVPRRRAGRTGADTRSTPPRSPGTPRRSGSASWSGSIPRPPPASCNAGSAREGTSDDTHEDRDRFAAARPGRGGRDASRTTSAPESTPLRKAAILLVSLEGPLASQLLAQLDRSAVEAVTLEIARLERIAPAEQQAVLEEFYGLGVRRLRFVFEDLVKMDDREIREAYHDEDAATWALALAGASRPVAPRCWPPCRRAPPSRSAGPWNASARSGSTTPRPPRPTSPNGSAASRTTDG